MNTRSGQGYGADSFEDPRALCVSLAEAVDTFLLDLDAEARFLLHTEAREAA